MSWYKKAEDFGDRNILNEKIHFFEDAADTIYELSKIVYQDATATREENLLIAEHKKISSYPDLKDVLLAADEIVLDSPIRFAAYMNEALYKIDGILSKLKRERDNYGKSKKQTLKGWV